MDEAVHFVFFLLSAAMLKNRRRFNGFRSASRAALFTMLLAEVSGRVRATLYPALSPKAGLLLGSDSACHQDTLRMQHALGNRTLWAERMGDAGAGLVVGGLWGARYHLGSFDACLSADAASPVGARYCLASLSALPGPSLSRTRCEPWDHVTSLDSESDALDALLDSRNGAKCDSGTSAVSRLVGVELAHPLDCLGSSRAPLAGLNLNALAGIRAINMVLSIGVHRVFNAARFPTSNELNTAESRSNPWHSLGHHAALLVDTCFFMSGLLMFLSAAARRRKESFYRTIFNRYLRFAPSYALVLVFYATAMESLGSGPLWKATTAREAEACRRWWWTNLLFVNNYVPARASESMCMLQSWSMAVDMQLFSLLLPLTCLWCERSVRSAWLWVGLVAALASPFIATLVHGWSPMTVWSTRALQQPHAEPMFYAMYVPTHMRAAPYLVGVFAGCALIQMHDRGVRLGRATTLWSTLGSLLAMTLVMTSSTLFGDLTQPPPGSLASALYASLSPAVWSAALGVLVVALTLGQPTGALVLLCWQPLVTLSRLSYGVYLVHFAVQLLQGGAERNPLHMSVATVVRSTLSDLLISLPISLWLYLSVEAPVRQLSKNIFSTEQSRLTSSSKGTAEMKTQTTEDISHQNSKEKIATPSTLIRNRGHIGFGLF